MTIRRPFRGLLQPVEERPSFQGKPRGSPIGPGNLLQDGGRPEPASSDLFLQSDPCEDIASAFNRALDRLFAVRQKITNAEAEISQLQKRIAELQSLEQGDDVPPSIDPDSDRPFGKGFPSEPLVSPVDEIGDLVGDFLAGRKVGFRRRIGIVLGSPFENAERMSMFEAAKRLGLQEARDQLAAVRKELGPLKLKEKQEKRNVDELKRRLDDCRKRLLRPM